MIDYKNCTTDGVRLCCRQSTARKSHTDFTHRNTSKFEIVSTLSLFVAMTHLDLRGCKDGALTNSDLQTIISKLPKLQVLKFSHSSCSDFALTGIENGEVVGVSLTALTGSNQLSSNNTYSAIL